MDNVDKELQDAELDAVNPVNPVNPSIQSNTSNTSNTNNNTNTNTNVPTQRSMVRSMPPLALPRRPSSEVERPASLAASSSPDSSPTHSTASSSAAASTVASAAGSSRLVGSRPSRPSRRARYVSGSQSTIGISRVASAASLARYTTEVSRIATHRNQHVATVGRRHSSRIDTKPFPSFGAGKPYPPPLPEREEYVVEFDGPDDPLHAQNWPMRKKIITASMLAYTTLTSAFASSVFSPAIPVVSSEFAVGSTVSTLGISLYVLGFAFGPTLWAPLSELRGRRLPLVLSMFGFTVFSAATATAKDLQTALICRFFAGLFGACPLAIVAAVFSDMFDNRLRGIAVTVFSMAAFSGPFLAGPVGGYIVGSQRLGWRWTEYLVTIMGAVAFVLDLLFLHETYPPVVLVSKAADLRRRTRNWGIHAKQEEIEVDLGQLLHQNFLRPLRMLFFEPIVLLLSLYTAFIYGLLYLFLTAYPLVFQQTHGLRVGDSGLPLFGMVIGQVLAGIAVILQQPWYQRKLAANDGVPVPEWRLPSVVAGGVSFAVGIFWFGWSGYRADVHWIVPTASGLFTGFGILSIFLQSINYLVDAYLMFAASVIAGNTFLRSLFGAAFPLFAREMFDSMGIQWASTMLGCIAFALVPIPLLFNIYGYRIRQRSAFAPTPPSAEDSTADEIGSGSGPGSASGSASGYGPGRGARIERWSSIWGGMSRSGGDIADAANRCTVARNDDLDKEMET